MEGRPESGEAPGPLIGTGRAADVFDIGGGRVFRRNRDGSSTHREAAVLTYLHSQSYPVPVVYESDGPDLIMKRINGPTMLDAHKPWKLRDFATVLVDLHQRLERVSLPDFELPCRFGGGGSDPRRSTS